TAVFPGAIAMACDGIVQIAGAARRISADVLRRELLLHDALFWAVARYTHLLLARSMQISVCNTFHPVEQRCIRWLLAVGDLVAGDDVPLTHELIATMLGVHRPTVTNVLRSLHDAGLVDAHRGSITLVDRRRLEAACCECYRILRDEAHRLERS